ncbi:Hypothetical protein SMAX5B_004397 [Scophthalmus maximus]|uniref:Uncharacterized protein n=1 Tax=Scophthalmus maximus TaxID=52904 RepID=A0A2U9CR67_SCOMX|nr:Hypothetical protein SMAX5B_004397 [Scophthalmus maximus]
MRTPGPGECYVSWKLNLTRSEAGEREESDTSAVTSRPLRFRSRLLSRAQVRMSAMHWEARRRQNALDRRTARDKHQLLQGGSESDTTCSATESNTTQEQTAGGRCPHCNGDLKTSVQYSAKIPNRSSSLQYTQQW